MSDGRGAEPAAGTRADIMAGAALLADAGCSLILWRAVWKVDRWSKIPLLTGWHERGTRDLDELEEQLARFPRAGLGMVTGAASQLFLLDIDGEEGAKSLQSMEDQHGPLPPTWSALTGRGAHYYFREPSGAPVKNSAGAIAPGLDTRGRNGFAVVPPSLHPTGRRYLWEASSHPEEVPLAAAPAWLLERTPRHREPPRFEPAPAGSATASANRRYVQAAVHRECAELVATPPGRRNDALNRSAYSLARFCAAGDLDAATVVRALAHAASLAGLEEHEIHRTLQSAFAARGAA